MPTDFVCDERLKERVCSVTRRAMFKEETDYDQTSF